jgi:DNA-binding LytR/AlgR family response regulator
MIRSIAIDDEPLALEVIETFCKRVDFLTLEGIFTSAGGALRYLEKHPVDLLFLDINMPAISGIDFYKSLRTRPMLIFTTSHGEYALESYDLNAVDYLLKPFSYDRFEKALLKARQIHDLVHGATIADEAKYIMLKMDYGLIKVILSDILFVEGLDNYLRIYLQNQPPLVVRLTMKSLMEQLNERDFARVHRSYIVAINKIESIKHKIITIAEEEIPVGRNYEEQLKSILGKKG